jgi:hypothetical protein
MPPRKLNSRLLRQLAEELLDKLAQDEDVGEDDRQDFATSLVRQWISYDGHATMFLGGQQFYFELGRTPLGKPCINPEAGKYGWMNRLKEDWKIGPDDLLEVLDQLNRGQSAEVVNSEGIPLRLWVDPKEKSRGVEPLVKENRTPPKRNYRKMAADQLEQEFGGYACIFVSPQEQLDLTFQELGDGMCRAVTERRRSDLESLLSSLGFSCEIIPEVIARLNLNQEVEFQDKEGIPSILWHDPKAKKMTLRKISQARTPPILCPKCTGVLMPWREGEQEQTCVNCGYRIMME